MQTFSLTARKEEIAAAVRETTVAVARQTTGEAPLVEVANVTKTFTTVSGPVVALDDVSIAIPANAFVTLLGPSGCGKTTLLRLLGGFEHPDAGGITLDGRDVRGDPPNKRPVNTVFQSYALFPHMTVAENVAFGLERQGRRRAATVLRVDEMLRLVRLDGMAARRPSQLSGGQQQRVALARALAPAPKLLLLDEPLSALDLKLRRAMQIELKRIQRETGVTFLLVTHDQEEALSMSDRIAVMSEGRILQTGAPAEIYETPNCRFVADFLGSNVVAGRLVGIDAPFAAIQPSRILLTAALDTPGIAGRLVDATYLGGRMNCTVGLADGTTVKVERDDLPRALAPGDRVVCQCPTDALVPLHG